MLLFPVLAGPPRGCLYCILQEISVGGPSDIPHTELFHNSTDVSGGGILGINNVFAIASHFSDRKIPAQGRSLDF